MQVQDNVNGEEGRVSSVPVIVELVGKFILIVYCPLYYVSALKRNIIIPIYHSQIMPNKGGTYQICGLLTQSTPWGVFCSGCLPTF